MQAALHQDTGTAKFYRLPNLFVDSLKLQDVSLFGSRPLQRPIKRTKTAKFRTKICVVDVAIDDVGDHALGMQLAPNRVGFHADSDEIIGAEEIQGLLFG